MDIKSNLIAFNTIIFDEIKRFLRIWPQTIIASAITVMLYFVIFSNVTNLTIEKSYHITYLDFLAPGLIMMSIITNAFGNVAFSLWNHRFQHSIEEVLVSPLPLSLILLGYTVSGMIRGLLVGALATLISLCFTDITTHNLLFSLFVALLTAALFSLAGFASAVCADKFDDILFFPNFILTPLIYLGGVFYSISQLTPAWQMVSKLNPLLYIINLFRFGLIGISDVNINLSTVMILIMIVLLFQFNLSRLRRGIRIAV